MLKQKPKKEPMSKINDKDLELILNGCFRYSLGRRTYMPSFTVDMIKEHKKVFNQWDWERFIIEINDYKRMYGDLGSDCDEQTWNELKNFAELQISAIHFSNKNPIKTKEKK